MDRKWASRKNIDDVIRHGHYRIQSVRSNYLGEWIWSRIPSIAKYRSCEWPEQLG
jgi:hypothetical protein